MGCTGRAVHMHGMSTTGCEEPVRWQPLERQQAHHQPWCPSERLSPWCIKRLPTRAPHRDRMGSVSSTFSLNVLLASYRPPMGLAAAITEQRACGAALGGKCQLDCCFGWVHAGTKGTLGTQHQPHAWAGHAAWPRGGAGHTYLQLGDNAGLGDGDRLLLHGLQGKRLEVQG